MTKEHEQKQLGEERVYFFLQILVYHLEKTEQDQKSARADTEATEECHL